MTVYGYHDPERFVTGTVGPPGQRVFFLQAHDGTRTTSVALEKEQVRVLAERLDAMLDLLTRRGTERGDDPRRGSIGGPGRRAPPHAGRGGLPRLGAPHRLGR